jgi:hypothetical protein
VLGSGMVWLPGSLFAETAGRGAAIDRARRMLDAGSIALRKDGKPLERPEERAALLEERAASFFRGLLPLLRQLGAAS